MDTAYVRETPPPKTAENKVRSDTLHFRYLKWLVTPLLGIAFLLFLPLQVGKIEDRVFVADRGENTKGSGVLGGEFFDVKEGDFHLPRWAPSRSE